MGSSHVSGQICFLWTFYPERRSLRSAIFIGSTPSQAARGRYLGTVPGVETPTCGSQADCEEDPGIVTKAPH